MRYILSDTGYIEEVSFGAEIICNDKNCTEYTGEIPSDYTSLIEWADNANIRAYKIVDGNLVYDADEDARLQEEYKKDGKTIWESTEGVKISSSKEIYLYNMPDLTPYKGKRVKLFLQYNYDSPQCFEFLLSDDSDRFFMHYVRDYSGSGDIWHSLFSIRFMYSVQWLVDSLYSYTVTNGSVSTKSLANFTFKLKKIIIED